MLSLGKKLTASLWSAVWRALSADARVQVPSQLDQWCALPGTGVGLGELSYGDKVVGRRAEGLVEGMVYYVVDTYESGRNITLRSEFDGMLFSDFEGDAKWFKYSDLARRGDGSMGLTLLHAAVMFGCTADVVTAVLKAAPEAVKSVDALGRLPLSIAVDAKSTGGIEAS